MLCTFTCSLLRGSRLCAFQSISRLTPCDALRGCTSLLRLGSVTKACPFRTPFDHPSTLRASTSASAPGSGAQALSYWLRPRAGYRRLRRPSTRLRASGGVMLSLRRQVSPGLCHRATPSSLRTLPSSRCRPALRPWPPRSRSHVRVASPRSRPATFTHARHVLARTRVSTRPSRGGCVVEDTGRTLLLATPHGCAALAAVRRVLLGPSGTLSAPSISVLGISVVVAVPPRAPSPTTRRCHPSPCDSCFGSACAGSARQGHRAHRPPRLTTLRRVWLRRTTPATNNAHDEQRPRRTTLATNNARDGQRPRPPRLSAQR